MINETLRSPLFASSMLTDARPRDVDVRAAIASPLVIYSDASFENGELRLGWVIVTDPPLGAFSMILELAQDVRKTGGVMCARHLVVLACLRTRPFPITPPSRMWW